MVDPVLALDGILRRAVHAALGSEQDPQVRRSTRADLQADIAPQLARSLGQTPEDIAARIVAAIPVKELIDRVVVAPGGLLNVTVKAEWLGAAVMQIAADERLAVPRATGAHRDRLLVAQYREGTPRRASAQHRDR